MAARCTRAECYNLAMNVELSERAQKQLERLVGEGAYPTAEAAVEAALAALEHPDFEGIDVVATR